MDKEPYSMEVYKETEKKLVELKEQAWKEAQEFEQKYGPAKEKAEIARLAHENAQVELDALRAELGLAPEKAEELEAQIITAMSPDKKEIRIDMAEQVKKINEFYTRKNIPLISENIRLTKESAKELKELAEKFGFDSLLFVPDISPQDLIDNKDFIIFSGSKEERQNSDPSDPI